MPKGATYAPYFLYVVSRFSAARSVDGATALICASQHGHAEVVRTLLTVDGIVTLLMTATQRN